ncbi:MAG: hypothetical protein H9533_07135 [Rhodobacteraceae bacterium]|nr:hypothetical protein [Paracoccaceae bacterium]
MKPDAYAGRAFQAYAVAFHLMMMVLLILSALMRTDGVFLYTLDDPYIHLALAESILEGGYGINAGEYASPSSSILYPVLLALGLLIGGGDWTPLALSAPFSLAATWMIAGFVWAVLDRRVSLAAALLLGPAIGFVTNAFALPLTGMEHSIHVFATVLALTGLYRLAVEPGQRGALVAVAVGTVLCATIRFEGLALALACLAGLVVLGFRREAAGLGAGVLLVLGAYAGMMLSLGLPVFPSSVMTKSDIAAQVGDGNAAGLIAGLMAHVWEAVNMRWGVLLALGGIVLTAAAAAEGPERRGRRVFLLVVAFVLFAHVAAGEYGWFGRYEVYAVAALLIGVLPVVAGWMRAPAAQLALPILLLVIAAPYFWTTAHTAAASANIHQQQFQMRRFAQEVFPQPVAVNDLGLVAYGNGNTVLDLWGLGSEEARRLSANNQWTADRLQEITERRGVSYAMLYPLWFREVPELWCPIADLVTSQVTSASETVRFYLIRRELEAEMRAALDRFAADLPGGARLTVRDCGAG